MRSLENKQILNNLTNKKMKNLNNVELVELNYNEMMSVEGGYSWEEFKTDVQDFFHGLNDGYYHPKKS